MATRHSPTTIASAITPSTPQFYSNPFGNGNNTTVVSKYNYFAGCNTPPGGHQNYQQWSTIGTGVTVNTEFNTVRPSQLNGAEAFQFYANSTGTLSVATAKNKTIIAIPAGSRKLLSYSMHGGRVGTGTVCDDYFFGIGSGMWGAFFPDSSQRGTGMIPAMAGSVRVRAESLASTWLPAPPSDPIDVHATDGQFAVKAGPEQMASCRSGWRT
jgi:hypothetical protein